MYLKSPINEMPQWQSPARFLAGWLCGLPAAAAPEKQARLASVVNEVHLVIKDEGEWILKYIARPQGEEKSQIHVSRKTIEIIWASCCAYFIFHRRVFEETPLGVRPVVDLDTDPEADAAIKLLIWAHEEFKNKTDRAWPVEHPRPCNEPAADSLEYQITQFYGIVMSFMLHHEIAHHRLGHNRSTIECENEADGEAADWLLGGLSELDLTFMFRSWGVAAGLGILVGRGIHDGRFTSTSHPRAFDRLWNNLHNYVRELHHPAWQMAIVVIHLHIALAGQEVPNAGTFSDTFSAVDSYVNYLAELADREPLAV